MFGTAISVVLIEYVRSGWKQQSKESSVDNKVATLETNTQMLLEKVEANNTRIAELSTVIVTQKTKIEDLNNKINTLDNRKNLRFATQASQTTEGRQIGKVIQLKSSSSSISNQASSDVTNSLLYQIAEETAAILMPFKKSQASVNQPDPMPVKVEEKPVKNANTDKKQPPNSNKTTTKNTDQSKNPKASNTAKTVENNKPEKLATKKPEASK